MERDKRVKGGRAGSTGERADRRNKGTKKGAAREANGRAGGDFEEKEEHVSKEINLVIKKISGKHFPKGQAGRGNLAE